MKLLVIIITVLSFAGCGLRMAPESHAIKVGQLEVYAQLQGKAKGEPVLFLHGGFQDHLMWTEQYALANDFLLVTIDLPGHGITSGIDSTLLIADVIKTVLDSLGIDKVSIVGLSLGAACAQDFAIAYPQRVNKAVFVSSGINGYDKKFPIDSTSMAWYPEMNKALEEKDTSKAAEVFIMSWVVGPYRKKDDMDSLLRKSIWVNTRRSMRQHRLMGWPVLNPVPAIEKLQQIKAPTLIVYGDKDLPLIPAASKYLNQQIQGSKLVVIPNTAHMVNMEQPAKFNEQLKAFLRGS